MAPFHAEYGWLPTQIPIGNGPYAQDLDERILGEVESVQTQSTPEVLAEKHHRSTEFQYLEADKSCPPANSAEIQWEADKLLYH
jgi:hypothetical protein